ncbi:MAG: hypothetical protein WA108_05590, partial [Thiobacillus sp.]
MRAMARSENDTGDRAGVHDRHFWLPAYAASPYWSRCLFSKADRRERLHRPKQTRQAAALNGTPGKS